MTEKRLAISARHDEDAETNRSSNQAFTSVLEAALSRRDVLRGTGAVTALAALSGIGISPARADDRRSERARDRHLRLGFPADPKNRDDMVTISSPRPARGARPAA